MSKAEYISKDGSLTGLLNKAYGRKETAKEPEKLPAYDPEPVITSEGQRTGRNRAALQEMLYGLNRFI